jgi:hypothetical protein
LILLATLLLTGCGSSPYSYEEPPLEAQEPAVPVEEPEVAAPAPLVESQPGGGIAWSDATDYAGTSQRVCGPLAGSGNSDDDVFLNLGRDYPDTERFQIVVWDIGGLDPIAYGATLCTAGTITLYEGVAQIELSDPGSIEIYE